MTRRVKPKRSRRRDRRDPQDEELRRQLEEQGLELLEYEITSDPIEEPVFSRLPGSVKNRIHRLYERLLDEPDQSVTELQALIEAHPDVPMLYNYLANAYKAAGRDEESEALVRESFQRFPDYIFARLNYVELCLQLGKYDEVEEIVEGKYDISLLYPDRKTFHISEVANFMGVIGLYFLKIGEREQAESYAGILAEIAPDFPATERLQMELMRTGLFSHLLSRRGKRRR